MTPRRVLPWLGGAVVALLLLVVLAVLGINTGPGRRFIAGQLSGFTTERGVNIGVGRIDGSIYGRMVLRDVVVRDLKGVLATAPAVTLDWSPGAYLNGGRIAIAEALVPDARLLRRPDMRPANPQDPFLPDIDLDLDRLRVDRLVIEPPVTGRRHIVGLAGSASIADGRATLALDAAARRGAGVAGGDRLVLRLDAVPQANRLLIDAALTAPAGGMVDGFAGLGRPLAARIAGRGSWASWSGRLTADSAGTRLANLALTASDGTFRVRGTADPGAVMTGRPAALLRGLAVDVTARLAERRVYTIASIAAEAFAVQAKGLVDLAENRFQDFKLDARLLRPALVAPDLGGDDVRLGATIDGPFEAPVLAYALNAARLSFGGTAVEGLSASGRARVDADRIIVPVSARARRVTGLNAAAGGLLTNLAVDGDLAWSNGQLLSDNLRLRSDRIAATAVVIADVARGRYAGTLNGRVNDYRVEGLGRVDLVTDARLLTMPTGGFGIAGSARVATRSFENSGLRDQLGGNAVMTADFAYDPAGAATLRNLRLASPLLRITDGSGSYRFDSGAIRLNASAVSVPYGPVTLVASGTTARPVAQLRAARPGLGLDVRNLVADVTGAGTGYRVIVRGQSAYGPLAGNVVLHTAPALAIDIESARAAGVEARGRVVRTAAGPFVGRVTLAGTGITGDMRLSASGANQRADVVARAQDGRIPGDVPITIGSGTLNAAAVLLPGGPSLNGSADLANVRSGTLLVARARTRFDYRGGAGTVALVANGTSSAPFDIAGQARLSPQRVVANARGSFNRIAFRLAAPAVATKTGGEWVLAPTRLVFGEGSAVVAGSYGRATRLNAAFDDLDVALANSFVPGLGLGGRATGRIDATLAAVPVVDARVNVSGFTRTAAYTISAPVDIATALQLSAGGGGASAVIRRGTTTIGRLQARIGALPPGDGMAARVQAAPLSGGVRYSGPAEVLWALTGIAGQEVSGPIAIAADFGGRVDAPSLTGTMRAAALRYTNQQYGTVVRDIALNGSFTRSELRIVSLAGRAGNGTVSAAGSVGLDAARGFPARIELKFDRARLAGSDALGAEATGGLTITNGPQGALVQGTLDIPEARYQFVRQGDAAVPQLSGVRRRALPGEAPQVAVKQEPPAPGLATTRLDVRVNADNRLFVGGMGLEAEWQTRMHITGTAAAPRVDGRLEVVRGTYSFAGRRFDLAPNGAIVFDGGDFTNPALSLAATTTVEGVTATINIGGRAQRPQISFTSTPALPQDEVLSRLLFGASITNISPIQAVQLAAALNSLRSPGGGLNPLGKLRSAAGIDRLRVLGEDKTSGRGTAVSAGQYIGNNIYVEVITDARGFTATQLEIGLTKTLRILSATGSFGGSNVTLRYSRDY